MKHTEHALNQNTLSQLPNEAYGLTTQYEAYSGVSGGVVNTDTEGIRQFGGGVRLCERLML